MSILPDQAFENLKPALRERLTEVAAGIHAREFSSFFDPQMRQILEQGLAEARAHEGTIWLLDENSENLTPACNSGPHAGSLVGKFKQPLDSGLISMVFASEQPFIENEVWKNAQQSKLLDSILQTQTCAMIAIPFYFLHACRGVLSCVILKKPGATPPEPSSFRPEHLARIQRASSALSQLIDLRLLSMAVGWGDG